MIRNLILIFALAIIGCSHGVEKVDLPGNYVFSFENISQHLIIGTDGKYVNAFYRDNSLEWSEQGIWTYYEAAGAGRTEITLDKFRFGIPEYASGGSWFVVPEKKFAGVSSLCFDPDLDRCFRRHE